MRCKHHPGRSLFAHSQLAGFGHLAAGIGMYFVDLGLACQAGGNEFLSILDEGVHGAPHLDFFPLTISGLVAG
ncbi:MAG: hypothetical protein BWX80_03720 [Candidatus Hydrogenedentes bacterium ADurb.Bin101]|nr:MAG: hypothetical protein BWX80_03720 [Candidatus Hydrogenedentes bacterium ADurb.Bin101]